MPKIRVNKYQLWAHLYFFFNSVGLAGGLLYTNLLTPFLYIWLVLKKREPVLVPVLCVLIPFDIIHIVNGIEWKSFLLSNMLFLSTYIFVACFNYFVNHYKDIEDIYKRLLLVNLVFVIIACVLYFTPFKDLLWYRNKFTKSVDGFYRLSLLTFEASYYALLFTPIAMFYLLKLFFGLNKQPAGYILLFTGIPLLLSLSLGVLGSMAISFLVLYILNWKKIFYKKRYFNVLFIGLSLLFCIGLIMVLFFPANALMVRINNIIMGVDTSTKGRTSDSFMMAWMIANERSMWFGSGLGQIKVLAYDIVKKYFSYWGELEVVRIPNAVAETMAIFGIFGLLFRFALIFMLFIKTKVLSNHYRTALFVFVFVYQFTGSYITNIVEYVIWAIVFSSAFKQFDTNKDKTIEPLK
ncbi:MAG: O-antigen ligase family protein [Bacteroidota bacterium]